jgi:general secretion pathway protein F
LAQYRYKAVNASGEQLDGDMEAHGPELVVQRLQNMGYVPIRVDEMGASGGSGSLIGFGRRSRLSQDDIALFTQEIATLLKAGLPLDRALEVIIHLSENEATQELVSQVREDVRGGATLHAAMEARQGVFSRLYLNMIRAGEASGALATVMVRLTEFMERSKELKETVKSAMIYPTILVMVAVLSVVVLLMFVVPQFSQMFAESGKALPLPTQIVIAAGDFFRKYWWALLLGCYLAYWGMSKQMANPASRYHWDERFLGLPLVGDLLARIEVARFSRTLGTLLANGVSLLSALSIVKETLTNSFMAERLDGVIAQLREGKGLGKPMLETGVFPGLAVHMVMVGEETGRLQEMLFQVADVFDREVQRTVKRMLALMEPVLILGLGLIIGGIIMSILVAILSVNDLAQ